MSDPDPPAIARTVPVTSTTSDGPAGDPPPAHLARGPQDGSWEVLPQDLAEQLVARAKASGGPDGPRGAMT